MNMNGEKGGGTTRGVTTIQKKGYVCLILNVILLVILSALGALATAEAATYYVAKDGNDSNPGTEGDPWQTIQKAADEMVAGDTVLVREGVYYERIVPKDSGSSGKFITYKAYPGNTPIIDGGGSGTVFNVTAKSYIKIKNLKIKNAGMWGILVEDSINIEIERVEVSHSNLENIQIRGASNQIVVEDCGVSFSRQYSGIDIYQYDGRPHHVIIKNCRSYHNRRHGISSEQADNLIIDSNVCYNNGDCGLDIGSGNNNTIRRNIIHNCATGIALSSNEDSEVYDNTIYDIKDEAIYSYCFRAHGEAHARNKWYRNIVYNSGFGIYESRWDWQGRKGTSSDHEFYNNLFYGIGSHGTYRVPFYFQGSTGIKFHNNTIYMNATYNAIQFLEGAINSEIKNNIISISGNKSPIIMDSSSSSGAVIDYNCYHNRGGTALTGPGKYSIADDPKFVDVANHDFHLQTDSPCIDAGDPTDLVPPDGGSRIDIGAYEYTGSRPQILPLH